MVIVDAKIKVTKKGATILVDGKELLKLSGEAFASLLNNSTDVTSDEDIEVTAFISTYDRLKSKFFGRDVTKTITKRHREYKTFKEALAISKRHGVRSDIYIDVITKSLNFGDKPLFPSPQHLVTPRAETVILDYLRDVDAKGTVEEQEINAEKYKKYLKKMEVGEASMKQAKYVARYEKSKFGEIKTKTKAYLLMFKSK